MQAPDESAGAPGDDEQIKPTTSGDEDTEERWAEAVGATASGQAGASPPETDEAEDEPTLRQQAEILRREALERHEVAQELVRDTASLQDAIARLSDEPARLLAEAAELREAIHARPETAALDEPDEADEAADAAEADEADEADEAVEPGHPRQRRGRPSAPEVGDAVEPDEPELESEDEPTGEDELPAGLESDAEPTAEPQPEAQDADEEAADPGPARQERRRGRRGRRGRR